MVFLATTIFLAFSLFNQKPGQSDTRTYKEVLTAMRRLNEEIKDVSIARENAILNAKVDEAVSKKSITAAEGEAVKLEARVIRADAELRAGIQRNDFGRMSNAFNTLHGNYLIDSARPEWKSLRVAITPHPQFPKSSYTPEELYKTAYEAVNTKSKTDLVFGFIPGYQLIDSLVKLSGSQPAISYTLAALILAFVVRLIVFPLAQKQYLWGRQMSQLQPLIQEIKERYTDKKTKQITNMPEFQAKTMELYKEYGINPFSGCWPALIQLPFFLMIYQCMLHYRFEFQNGIFLWINPVSGAQTNGWIAPNLGERDYILIFVYAVSMIVTTLLTPVNDPANAKQQRLMGVAIAAIFSIMMFFYPLPSAFTLYWIFTNIFATAQMLYVYRMPVPALKKVVNAQTGGILATDPPSKNGANHKTGTPVRHRPKKKK